MDGLCEHFVQSSYHELLAALVPAVDAHQQLRKAVAEDLADDSWGVTQRAYCLLMAMYHDKEVREGVQGMACKQHSYGKPGS